MGFYIINLLDTGFMRPDTVTVISLKARSILDLIQMSWLYGNKSITGLKNSVI